MLRKTISFAAVSIGLLFASCATAKQTPVYPYPAEITPWFLEYWGRPLGTRAPELPQEEQCALVVNSNRVRWLLVDGIEVDVSHGGALFLPPGKHKFQLSYSSYSDVNTGNPNNPNDNKSITVSFPNATLEDTLKAGSAYEFGHDTARDTSSRAVFHEIIGYNPSFNSILSLKGSRISRNPNPDFIILEPYDPAVPSARQCLLSIKDGIAIVEFDGKPVHWGGNIEASSVNIAIPSGQHTLRLYRDEDDYVYQAMINSVAGHSYSLLAAPMDERVDYKSGYGFYSVQDHTVNGHIDTAIVARRKR